MKRQNKADDQEQQESVPGFTQVRARELLEGLLKGASFISVEMEGETVELEPKDGWKRCAATGWVNMNFRVFRPPGLVGLSEAD